MLRTIPGLRALAFALILGIGLRGAGHAEPVGSSPIPSGRSPGTNRLVHEGSPYLRLHATNPVDWYPWGPEAFEVARREGKPIFLSVGYSTCHWCHVMARESFESDEVARALARDFVAVKVDREERPDVDALYMDATSLLHGQGGWPNSVWLTPDREPFFAATYLPRPQLLRTLERLAVAWRTRRAEVEAQAARVAASLARMGDGSPGEGAAARGPLDHALVAAGLDTLRASFSDAHGGFGKGPLFPPHHALDLLLYEIAQRPAPDLLGMVTATLDGMARGGIHDHVGGGFHRYATDAAWFQPHFEKMLYDNGLLLRAYAAAFRATAEARYREVADGIATWALREMADPGGGFHSALDAESAGGEGRYYMWTPAEVEAALGAAGAARFAAVYGITAEGNFRDEATGRRTGASLPHLPRPLEEVARERVVPVAELGEQLAADRARLLVARGERPAPRVDDKVLVAWNGYMIRGLAAAGRHLGRPRYTEAAVRAAAFVLGTMREGGRLRHSYRGGVARLEGYLDDHAALAMGLLELHEATGEARWRHEATALAEAILASFRDPDEGGFFSTSPDHEALLARRRDPTDGAEPSGQGLAVQLLVRLSALTGEARYRREARRALEAYRPSMARDRWGSQSLLLGLAQYLDLPPPATGEAEVRIPPVRLRLVPGPREVRAGEAMPVEFELALDEGWHVNAAAPARDDLIATTLELVQGAPASLEEVRFPAGHLRKLAFVTEPLELFEGTVRIPARVRVAPGTPAGPLEVVLRLRAQACDDRRCLPPTDHDLPLRVEVSEK